MVVEHFIEGYEAFKELIGEFGKSNETVYVFFCGSHRAESESWCPDCVRAEPIVLDVVKTLPDSIHFVHVGVGNKTLWKDPACPFRTDEVLHLKSIPTLIEWKGTVKLECDEDFCKEKLENLMLKS